MHSSPPEVNLIELSTLGIYVTTVCIMAKIGANRVVSVAESAPDQRGALICSSQRAETMHSAYAPVSSAT